MLECLRRDEGATFASAPFELFQYSRRVPAKPKRSCETGRLFHTGRTIHKDDVARGVSDVEHRLILQQPYVATLLGKPPSLQAALKKRVKFCNRWLGWAPLGCDAATQPPP